MENSTPASTSAPSSFPSGWFTRLLLVAAVIAGGYWCYYAANARQDDTKYAFASSHYFEDPMVFYGGKGLRYEVVPSDTRLLKVYVPDVGTNLAGTNVITNLPKYLLAEDGELDYLGFVKKEDLFIPLQLYQIHDARPEGQESPVIDCKTYLELADTVESILVMIDGQYLLRGSKVRPNKYMIPFCETTREHQFTVIRTHQGNAPKGQSPAAYAFAGQNNTKNASPNPFNYRIHGSGETIRFGDIPVTYGITSAVAADSVQETGKIALTKVIFSVSRQLETPWVYVDGKKFSGFMLNKSRTQLRFTVPQSNKAITVRVGDRNCECTASGYPLHSTLELAGYCDCRDIQVTVQLDPGLDRFRNKIRIYIDGQLSDITLPPAGRPFTFPIRKTGQDQQVALKLLMADDSGQAGLIDVCSFSVPNEATTVNLNPDCHCEDCPPNLKVSGK